MSQIYLEKRKAERMAEELRGALAAHEDRIAAQSICKRCNDEPGDIGSGYCRECELIILRGVVDRLDDLIQCDCGRGPIPLGNGTPDCCLACSRDAMDTAMHAFISAGHVLLDVWVDEACDTKEYARVFVQSFEDTLAQLPLVVLPSTDSRPCPHCGTQVAFQEACRRCGR